MRYAILAAIADGLSPFALLTGRQHHDRQQHAESTRAVDAARPHPQAFARERRNLRADASPLDRAASRS
jgi:hypothetical protein